MALDEALGRSVKEGGLPFLRFYQWNPATLSLGRFQNPGDGLGDAALSVPRVRRETGGGAIWHDQELTYSLGCTQEDLGLRGVKPSFEKLTGFLLDTWIGQGWDAGYARDAGKQGSWGAYTPACFAGTEEYDILVGGRKLGGNAQRRDRTMIFQHGSIPDRLDQGRLDALFLPGFRPTPGSVTDLQSCGWSGGLDALRDLLTAAFLRRLDASGREDRPSDQEWRWADDLVATRYGTEAWTESGGGALRSLPPSSDPMSAIAPPPPRG